MTGASQQHPSCRNVHVHHAQGLVVLELMGRDCPHHDNHMTLYQLVPGSQSRKLLCSLTSSSSKGGRSTPTLPFHPHWCTALEPPPRPPIFMQPWGGLCLLILICSIKLLSPLHATVSPPFPPLQAGKATSVGLLCPCFPDSRQVHVSAEIVLHPRHRGWGGGAWNCDSSVMLEI